MLKLDGGITCCTAFTNFYLSDNRTGANYERMWYDNVANISVFRVPSMSVSSTDIRITGVVNPYPIQKETYEQLKKIEISFYSANKHVNIKQIDQRPYTDFSQLSQIQVSTDFVGPAEPPTSSYAYHTGYPMTYDISYSTSLNSYSGRKLSHTILQFTSGVASIEKAYIRINTTTPGVVNPVLDVKIFKDTSNYWCLKITGMDDNTYSTSYAWSIRMRFYPNGNTLSYGSITYAANGEI